MDTLIVRRLLILSLTFSVGFSVPPSHVDVLAEEGTTAVLSCQPVVHTNTVLKASWSIVKSTLDVIRGLFSHDEKVNSNTRYSLNRTGLTIKQAKISDEGYYLGTISDESTKEIFEECLIHLTVYIEPEVKLVIDPGPHEVGKRIDVKCLIERIYPRIGASSFNITLPDYRSISGEVDSVVDNVPRMVIHASLDASMDYDDGKVICQVTTALGRYKHSEEHLQIFMRRTMILHVTNGPYIAGNNINISCRVLPVTDNESPDVMDVFLGGRHLSGSATSEDMGNYKKLSFNAMAALTNLEGHVNITCVHHFINGSLEKVIMIAVLGKLNNRLLVIIGVSVGIFSAILIGVLVYVVVRWLWKEEKCQSSNSKGFCHFRISQYDQINESEIEHAEGVPLSVVSIQPREMSKQVSCTPGPKTAIPTPTSGTNVLRTTNTSNKRRGKDVAVPYMIKVFEEPHYLNDRDVKDTVVEAVEHKERDPSQKQPDDYISVKSTSSEESVGESTDVRPIPPEAGSADISTAATEDTEYDDTALPDIRSTIPSKTVGDGYEDMTKGSGAPLRASTEVEGWLKANYISQETCNKLHREMICKMSDLKGMTEQDILCLQLPIGEAIRLRMSIEKLH